MKGEVESIQDPQWWNQDSVMTVMDHVCEKLVSLLIISYTLDHAKALDRDAIQA